MGTGPRRESGYDLALTELSKGSTASSSRSGSERGAEVLAALPHRPAAPRTSTAARRVAARRAHGPLARQTDLRELLAATSSTRAGTRSPSAA